jgi:protein-L-isoaspartate(D-aspartate) O-methyltransferase
MLGSSKKSPGLYSLIDSLINHGVITSSKVHQTMLKVDRGEFCHSSGAYDDCPQPIGFGATISAPHMHAYCLVIILESLTF